MYTARLRREGGEGCVCGGGRRGCGLHGTIGVSVCESWEVVKAH